MQNRNSLVKNSGKCSKESIEFNNGDIYLRELENEFIQWKGGGSFINKASEKSTEQMEKEL
jgi:hypothetical protein